jgi:TolB-like protein
VDEIVDSSPPESHTTEQRGSHGPDHRWRLLRSKRFRFGSWLLAAVVVGSATEYVYGKTRETKPDGLERVAVLPFRPLAANVGDEYLALGMADAVITRLASLKNLHVSSTSSVVQYANTSDPISAGRALRVGAVVDGRFQLAGDRIRVTVQLLDVEQGTSLWAETFDEPFRDVFAVQDAIANRVANALVSGLSSQERELLAPRYTESAPAYKLYARGRFFFERRTPVAVRKSVDYYKEAIEIDPNYALAHAGLADSYMVLGMSSFLPPGVAFARAKDAAIEALRIDPSLAQAEVALALATYLWDRDWDAAERMFKRALARAPNYGLGHQWYAVCLVSRGRFDEAVAATRHANQLDPTSLTIHAAGAWIYYLSRQNTAAIAQALQTSEMDSTFGLSHAYLGFAYVAEKRLDDAASELRKALKTRGWVAKDVGALGQTLALLGDSVGAKEMLRMLDNGSYGDAARAHGEALIRVGLGQYDRALALVEKAIDDRYPWAMHYNIDPALDPLRADPRFAALLRRIPLPEMAATSPTKASRYGYRTD